MEIYTYELNVRVCDFILNIRSWCMKTKASRCARGLLVVIVWGGSSVLPAATSSIT